MPAERIVRHVLSVTPDGDWAVWRDALDAVLRRCASVHADEIRIVERPRGRLLGLYKTRRRGSRARPYRTLLRQVEPIDGSCECADFLRNSLGLCKHLVAVLDDVASKRRRADVADERDSGGRGYRGEAAKLQSAQGSRASGKPAVSPRLQPWATGTDRPAADLHKSLHASASHSS